MPTLSPAQSTEILQTLKTRFEKNMHRHPDLQWDGVRQALELQPGKLWSLSEMERTGGEPDVVMYMSEQGHYTFFDCAAESPLARRSLCYDRAALDARKANKPAGSVCELAEQMGVELMDEAAYRHLQTLGAFDTKTSSWIKTPEAVRGLGGALFCDRRYDTVFVYHNGAESYYSARGFRGVVRV